MPPVARGLPDRFVVTVVQGSQVSRAVGNPIPAELVVGLPPGSDPSQLVQQGKVVLGPGMAWLIDPAEAQRVGMLVDVTLAQPGAPVDQVFAVGVRGSLDPAGGAAELTRLLEAHRYATGAAFLTPGTPTNNTETDRSAWTRHPAPAPPPTRVVPSPPAGTNAQVTATAFGLAPDVLAPLPYAGGTDQPLAAAAHTALWQATWGTFIDRLLVVTPAGPTIDDSVREAWRDLWQDHVRGRGPLPLMQLGDQPYGLLPAAAVHGRWRPDPSDRLESPLLGLLRNARQVIAGGLPNVPRVDGPGPLDDTLLEIMGSAPHLLGLRVRSVASETLVSYTGTFFGVDGTNQPSQDALDAVLWQQLGVAPGSAGLRGALGQTTRPLGLPLVDDSDKAFVDALLAVPQQPRTVGSVLQALLELSAAREQAAVAQAAPDTSARTLVERAKQAAGDLGQEIAGVTEMTLAGRLDPGRLRATADRLAGKFGVAGPSALAALQPVPAVRSSLAAAALSPGLPGGVAASQAISALGAWFRAQARWAQFQDAARQLVAAPTADRHIVVAETLDCASHRYDAWVSALPAHRLAGMRSGTPTGVLLGAYGWVEGLAPGAETTRPGGFVHAPSLTHAATAGVLRSGYLTHNPDAAGSGALAIDLSSARVRSALDVLDGVRGGQPLGALLGYVIERRLHENQLDRFTLSLRALAPVVAGRLTDRADATPDQAKESLAANNVVDGLRLLALPRAQVRTALDQAPADNPYLPADGWAGPTDAEWALIGAALDEAAAGYDAASDVLVAEAVHHLVQGNTARAAAAMDAAAGGDAVPVEPEVVRTPTRATALTHRVLLLLGDTPAGSGGWSATTPRAVAEPRLAAWAESRLGAAGDIVIHVDGNGTRTTMDADGLSALDVVFDCGQPDMLARRLRAALPGIGDDPLPAVRDPAWPAGLRAVGEVAVVAAGLLRLVAGSQPLGPAAFSRPSDSPTRAIDPSGLAPRLTAVVDGLGTAVSTLGAALAADPQDQAALAAAVDGLRPFGISLPPGGPLVAQAALAEATRRHDRATALLAAAPFDASQAQAVGEAVFGAGFAVLAPVGPGPAPTDLYGATFGIVDPGRARLRRWLRDVATVRPAVARYATTLLFADAQSGVGSGPGLAVAQLAATGTAGTTGWLGLALAPGEASPDQPVTDLLIEAPGGYTATDAVAGLVVDEWVEQLPRRDAGGTATVTTGLAVNANAPNARAPQAVLLAVSPDGSRWTADGLTDVLRETLELATLRGVTLERTTLVGRILPALQEQSWSLQGETTLDPRLLATEIASVTAMMPYVKESGA